MHINQTKKREMAKFYKNLLEPMGFTVVPVDEKEKKKEPAWKPADTSEFEAMNSAQITKKIKTLKEREDQLNRQMLDIKQKAVEFLNNREPNDLTSSLYTGTYGKNVVPGNVISVTSEELRETQHLLKYLADLRLKTQQQELSNELAEKLNIKSAEVLTPIGGSQRLEITL
jgi:hypothetical protein